MTAKIKERKVEDLKIVDWFQLNKVLPYGFNDITRGISEILEETAKAYRVITGATNDNNDIDLVDMWVPKKCTESISEYTARTGNRVIDHVALIEERRETHKRLVEYAKSHGVPGVRSNMHDLTIVERMKIVGVEVPEWVHINEADRLQRLENIEPDLRFMNQMNDNLYFIERPHGAIIGAQHGTADTPEEFNFGKSVFLSETQLRQVASWCNRVADRMSAERPAPENVNQMVITEGL